MSRNFFAAIVVVTLLLIQSAASAGYQKYLNGDRNYVLFDGYQGVARYVVRDTLKIEAQNPYTLSIDWVTVSPAFDGGDTISERDNFCFAYDRAARKIFVVDTKTDERRYLPRDVSRAEGAMSIQAAEIAFYLSTGEKFFGDFSDEFYPDR